MARTVKDTSLDSRAARSRLRMRLEPYWRAIEPGAHLGYYKGARGGSWLARLYWDGRYHKAALGTADDASDADGIGVFSFAQAQAQARTFFERKRRELSGLQPATTGPYTVSHALDDYEKHYTREGRGLAMVQSAVRAHIKPTLGEIEVARLTTEQIRSWHQGIADAAPLVRKGRLPVRGKAALALKGRPAPTNAEGKRQRRATANRILSVLKAALNFAFHSHKAASDDPWRKVKPFRGVDTALVRYLTEGEAQRLVNASSPALRALVRAALLTGCRYGELTRLRAADFNADAGTLLVRESKSGKPRHVVLTDEGRRFFAAATAGKAGDDLLFLRAPGKTWGKSDHRRPLTQACKTAKISPAIGFHVLRHTHGSMLAMRGTPLAVIAKQLGHADTRMTERHYAHLSPSYVADTIRANMPTLGIVEAANVTALSIRTAQ